jgi:hypothetical protein
MPRGVANLKKEFEEVWGIKCSTTLLFEQNEISIFSLYFSCGHSSPVLG